MVAGQLLWPGARHPYAPMSVRELSRFLHVAVADVQRWIQLGLPQNSAGLIDLFTCSNWLCWGHLDDCPTLARRWRTYLLFFAPFLAGEDRPRHVTWKRTQRLYLPDLPDTKKDSRHLTWWTARASPSATQQVERDVPPSLSSCTTISDGDWWRVQGNVSETEPHISMESQLRLSPTHVLDYDSAEQRELAALVEQVAADFRYEYRHHQPWEYRQALSSNALTRQLTPRWVGSCLDCALALGVRLNERSRPWRLKAGMVADSRIANPHFWLEAQTLDGQWAPLDPTLPAIVRMVGGDWRAAVRAWSGACDARRVTLGTVGAGLPDIPGGASVGSLMGEAVVDGINAWPCLDWVCGDCEADFTELS